MLWFSKILNLGKAISDSISAVSQAKNKTAQTQITSQADVLLADAKGNWVQRLWRPFLGIVIGMILGANYAVPIMWNVHLQIQSDAPIAFMDLPDELWVLIISAVTVFGGTRTWQHIRRSQKIDAKHALKMAKHEKKSRRRNRKRVRRG